MKTIALVVGHGPVKDKGAVAKDGTTELGWNTDLAPRIAAHIGTRAKVVVIHRRIERQSPVVAVNGSGAAIAVELHLNAADGTASGTEMIHAPNSVKGAALARVLQSAAVSVLNLPNRGVKPPWKGRGAAFLTKTKMPAVIVESFFIDRPSDLARGNARKDALAAAYADALVRFLA